MPQHSPKPFVEVPEKLESCLDCLMRGDRDRDGSLSREVVIGGETYKCRLDQFEEGYRLELRSDWPDAIRRYTYYVNPSGRIDLNKRVDAKLDPEGHIDGRPVTTQADLDVLGEALLQLW